MKKTLIITISLCLAGCASYQWVKPGRTAADGDAALLQCQAAAIRELPPNNQLRSNDTYKRTKCDRDSSNKCKKDSDSYYDYTDTNEDARNTLIEACMARGGWRQVEISN